MWPPLESKPAPFDWYAAAVLAVRRYCGWHVTPVIEEDMILDGPGGGALLVPSNQVLELVSLSEDGNPVDVDSVSVSRAGVLRKKHKARWTDELGGIELTLKHGYDEADDLLAVVEQVASRSAATGSGAVQEQAGPFGIRRSTLSGGGVASAPLLESEKQALEPYRLSWGV